MKEVKLDAGGGQRGFSLIEMLLVLTVIGMLFAFSAPQLFSLLQSSSLSTEGSLFRNKLTQAQQMALSQNTDIEIRFFRYGDEMAGEPDEQFRAYQFFRYGATGEARPVSEFFRLKPPVVFSNQPALSSVLQSSDETTSPSFGEFPIPLGSKRVERPYVAFRFRPDGSTDLPGESPTGDTWHITMVDEQREVASGDSVPDNFFSVQIDPFNGKLHEYRP